MDNIYIGKAADGSEQKILLKYSNRHGLIAGATGTGKTITLQGLAEGFSEAGVPVFIADVKGDLSGICSVGMPKPALVERAKQIGYTVNPKAFPVIFWDIFGKSGHNVRVTISEMGPLLLSRLLDLNDTQEGVLNIAFAVADAEGLLLLDLEDLRAILAHISENSAEYGQKFGNVAPATVAAIQRSLLTLENRGAKNLFGEPGLDISDLMKIAPNGYGAINILAADSLMQSPKLYSTFMLWLLSELFEDMPEVGDMDKPKLVFFFDEAHLLFDEAPKALLEKIEQLVKLIRSKGVGVYFITQNPADIPESVLGQLSNRVQHALRAFTPKDQKGVRAAAETFRPNPSFDTSEAITNLGVGEALVSCLDEKGTPNIVQKTLIKPPSSLVGACSVEQRTTAINNSPVKGKYDQALNRESAHEVLNGRVQQASSGGGWGSGTSGSGWGNSTTNQNDWSQSQPQTMRGRRQAAPQQSQTSKLVTSIATSVVRAAGTQVARSLTRGLLKSLLK